MLICSLRFVVQRFDLTSSFQDATTNPSLILAAVGNAKYARLINVAIVYAKDKGGNIDAQAENAADRLVSETALERTWFGTDVIGVGFQ